MLTALSIEKDESRNVFLKTLKSIGADKIEVTDYESVRGVRLRCVTYNSRRKKINWNRLSKILGEERSSLIYCGQQLPSDLGFYALNTHEFKTRLCTNMILYTLSKCENIKNIKIALYDLKANHSELLPYLSEYCDGVTVVTKAVSYYCDVAQALIEETGASTIITRNDDALSDFDIIISPDRIDKRIIAKNNAMLFTAVKPKFMLNCQVYYNYEIKLPGDLEKYKPKTIDNVTFLSALYSKGKMFSLGSVVPTVCSGLTQSHTLLSLVKQMNNIAVKS